MGETMILEMNIQYKIRVEGAELTFHNKHLAAQFLIRRNNAEAEDYQFKWFDEGDERYYLYDKRTGKKVFAHEDFLSVLGALQALRNAEASGHKFIGVDE